MELRFFWAVKQNAAYVFKKKSPPTTPHPTEEEKWTQNKVNILTSPWTFWHQAGGHEAETALGAHV